MNHGSLGAHGQPGPHGAAAREELDTESTQVEHVTHHRPIEEAYHLGYPRTPCCLADKLHKQRKKHRDVNFTNFPLSSFMQSLVGSGDFVRDGRLTLKSVYMHDYVCYSK